MRRTPSARRSTLPVVLATTMAVAVASCSGDDEPSPPTNTSTRDSASTAQVQQLDKENAELDAWVVEIGGGIKKKQRHRIGQQIAEPIRAWTDAAYLAGGFPRSGYSTKDFPGWTGDAAALAVKDKAVTTNAAVSKKVVRVVANQRDARLFVFGFRGRTGGATAKIFLSITAEKESGKSMRYAVAGNLYLTRKSDTWRIFGYDLHRTVMHK